MVFDVDEPNTAVAVIGSIVFGAALWLLHHRPEGAFIAHAAVAFATAGTALVAAGIGVPAESVGVAAAASLPFAVAAIWQQRSLLLQFLVVSIAVAPRHHRRVGPLAEHDHRSARRLCSLRRGPLCSIRRGAT